MVSGGIAHTLNTPVWLNKNREIVELEEEAFGLKIKYLLHYPSKLIFIDEVGSNTSQTTVEERSSLFQMMYDCIKAATEDSHFTVLSFTAATGEPSMCMILFVTKELDPSWVLSMDPFITWVKTSKKTQARARFIQWELTVTSKEQQYLPSAAVLKKVPSPTSF